MAREQMVYVFADTFRSALSQLRARTGWTKQVTLNAIDVTAPTYDRWYSKDSDETITRNGVDLRVIVVSSRHVENVVNVFSRELGRDLQLITFEK